MSATQSDEQHSISTAARINSEIYMINIYNNVLHYINYRGLNIISEQDDKKFWNSINASEYYNIVVFNPNNNEYSAIVITNRDGRYSDLNAATKTMTIRIWNMLNTKSGKGKAITSMIYICGVRPFAPHLVSDSGKSAAEVAKIQKFSEIEGINVKYISYNVFLYNMPTIKIIPKHSIVNEEEINNMMSFLNIKESELPKISIFDPPVVWLGAEVGDVIRIDRLSPVTGITPVYRKVIA